MKRNNVGRPIGGAWAGRGRRAEKERYREDEAKVYMRSIGRNDSLCRRSAGSYHMGTGWGGERKDRDWGGFLL